MLVILRSGVLACLLGLFAQLAQAADVSKIVGSLCEKRVVALGELPSHGEVRAFQFKAELARGLVEQCGFEAVLFEAPIYDFLGLLAAVADSRANARQLDNAIGKFWWMRELAGWRQWLLDAVVRRRVQVGGLDDQLSATSVYAEDVLPALVGKQLGGEEGDLCAGAVRRNLSWEYGDGHVYDSEEKQLLFRCVRNAHAAERSVNEDEQRMLTNLTTDYARLALEASARGRDEVMFQNLMWHMTRLPPEAKVVVWTANVHAAREGDQAAAAPMGSWLAMHFADGYAAIGGTARRGWSRMAGGKVKMLEMAPPESLEAQAIAGVDDVVYLDGAGLKALGAVSSRLPGYFMQADWGRRFDGVYVVSDELTPTPDWGP